MEMRGERWVESKEWGGGCGGGGGGTDRQADKQAQRMRRATTKTKTKSGGQYRRKTDNETTYVN